MVAAIGDHRIAVLDGVAGCIGLAGVWLACREGEDIEEEEGCAVHVVLLPPAVSIHMTLLAARLYHLDLWITVGVVVVCGLIAWLWWLWRKFRVRRPPKKVPK